MATFQELVTKVEAWADSRKILFPSNAKTQVLKAVSELGELCDAQIKDQVEEQKDAVGDVLVCLINYCACRKFNIVDCLEGSYNVIMKRKGVTNSNGVFVKD